MSKKLLVIGANGMLGGSIFRYFSKLDSFDVLGTVRSEKALTDLYKQGFSNLVSGVDVLDLEKVAAQIDQFKPDYIFNCVGLIKQIDESKNPISAIEINALLPHQLGKLASEYKAKLIHFSTDCVFSGSKGTYTEAELPDATDIYGRSKLLGEIGYNGHLTLRTSIIGHEIDSDLSLVDWFLSQTNQVRGFSKAIFSGLPTCYVAEVIERFVLPNDELSGVYHLSVEPIDKFKLLTLVKDIYGKNIEIQEYSDFEIDRSLDSTAFRSKTNFEPLPWPELIQRMHNEFSTYFK